MADQPKEARGITAIAVSGFKSLRDESRIEIRNLTVLAGANSSGKSSIMQPLLLLKQTLEAPYDPGPLKLDGPNVSFTETNELFWMPLESDEDKVFQIALTFPGQNISTRVTNEYASSTDGVIQLESTHYSGFGYRLNLTLREGLDHEQLLQQIRETKSVLAFMPHVYAASDVDDDLKVGVEYQLIRPRAFWKVGIKFISSSGETPVLEAFIPPVGEFETEIAETIHVPGERTASTSQGFPSTAIRPPMFPGKFEYYTAALIERWQRLGDPRYDKLNKLMSEDLRLTSRVATRRFDANRVQIQIGRSLYSHENELVSIEHVGFGVSQVLPVLAALLVAEPGQLVYIEQPELHLHPRAQVKLAEIIADAANRGVRVVVETHSDLLILGIQTLVAEGKLATDKVILHWFQRDSEGVTHITSTELDKNGAFSQSDWPEDFAEVRLDAQSRFLDAADIAELTSDNAE